jgi:hypothetical protein
MDRVTLQRKASQPRYRSDYLFKQGDSASALLFTDLAQTLEEIEDERFADETWRWLDRLGS